VAFGRYGVTRRARLASSCGGPGGQIATSISIPEALSSPALAFWIEGTPGAELYLSLDVGYPLAPVRAATANRRAVVCLPEGLRGLASELRVTVESSPTCDSATSKTVYLDDFELVSDPSCAREP
jgi:hypothetical protein